MRLRLLAFALCFTAALILPAPGLCQDHFTVGENKFFFEPRLDQNSFRWSNACLVTLKRDTLPLMFHGANSGSIGAISIPFTVQSCSIDNGPTKLTIQLGVGCPPMDFGDAAALSEELMKPYEQAFSKETTYVALITRPADTKWPDVKSVVPRFFLPLTEPFAFNKGDTRRLTNLAVARALRTAPKELTEMLTSWLQLEWRMESDPYSKITAPGSPHNQQIFVMSGKPADRAVADAILAEAKNADATKQPYLALFAVMWGSPTGATQLFKSCQDPKMKSEPDLLNKIANSGKFPVLTLDEAIEIARSVKPEYRSFVLHFVVFSNFLSEANMKDLYLLTPGMNEDQRRDIYHWMINGLPIVVQRNEHNTLSLLGHRGEPIENEDAVRRWWDKYFGISGTVPP